MEAQKSAERAKDAAHDAAERAKEAAEKSAEQAGKSSEPSEHADDFRFSLRRLRMPLRF